MVSGPACWTGALSGMFAYCCSGSGNPLCWDNTHQYDSCCHGTVPSLSVPSIDPSVRCLKTVGVVKLVPHLASCKEDNLFVEVSRTTRVLWSELYADEPWFLRFRDIPREVMPLRPIAFTHVGHLCVPKVCSAEALGAWLAPMLAPWWLPSERVVRKPEPLNDTHVVLPPRLGFRQQQFPLQQQAWVTFSAAQASEPYHLVLSEHPRSVHLQPGTRPLLVAVAIPVIFAGVLKCIGINAHFLEPLAPQRSVKEALTAQGATYIDTCRVLFTILTLILHTRFFSEWRDELRGILLFRNINVSFATLSIFLSLREHKGIPLGWWSFVRHVVPRFLKMTPVLWFGVYLRSVLPLRQPGLQRHTCLQPRTLLSSLFFVHEIMFLEKSPCGIIDIFESLFHVELCIWTLVSMFGGRLGICALILWPISVLLDSMDPQTGMMLSQSVGHSFTELLPPALATAAVHCGLRGKMKSRRLWLWGASLCLLIFICCELRDLGPLSSWREAEFQVNRNKSVLLRLWLQSVNLLHIVGLVIILNVFDQGCVSQKAGVLSPLIALCSRLSPIVLALHTMFFEFVNDYGRSFFDDNVFSFIGECFANIICCFLVASPVYFSLQVPANVLAMNFKDLLRVRGTR
eukprot:CAMPEP_0194495342 /NCGR_PEP_ID=MMETSP0253-20130528/12981_1 /TAXON_ID=2966 /ORGANISM="Noctiluca scintillans" /LENGTH=628 /DNA_ID=CAMNT_0039336589 /DNA_START=244 /DNA_END=2130 /DNA_ORIENTATION=+